MFLGGVKREAVQGDSTGWPGPRTGPFGLGRRVFGRVSHDSDSSKDFAPTTF